LVIDVVIDEVEVEIRCQRNDGVDQVFSTTMAWLRAERPSEDTLACSSLVCAPAIVRAANLMAVRGSPLQSLNPEGEFYRRCFYHALDSDLRAGSRHECA
jgi:hypothetical protein